MAQKQLKVFFDLDGTLIDVSARHYAVYRELTGLFGGIALSKTDYWSLKRKKTAWSELLEMSRIEQKNKDVFLDEFINKIESPEYLAADKLFLGAIESLGVVSAQRDCYLVSLRRNKANLLQQINNLRINQYFEQIVSGHSENDGSDVKTAAIDNILGSDSGVIIGDTEADILTGKALGMTTIAVLSGIRDEQFLSKLEPDYLLPGIDHLLTVPLFRSS